MTSAKEKPEQRLWTPPICGWSYAYRWEGGVAAQFEDAPDGLKLYRNIHCVRWDTYTYAYVYQLRLWDETGGVFVAENASSLKEACRLFNESLEAKQKAINSLA